MKLDWDTTLKQLGRKTRDNSAYVMSPKKAQTMSNAFTPYDLMMKPTNIPFTGILPSTAFNSRSTDTLGVPNISVISPEAYASEDAPGILAHEQVHSRQLPVNKPNQGYTTFAGQPGRLGISEKPAMRAEDNYWQTLDLLQKILGKRQ